MSTKVPGTRIECCPFGHTSCPKPVSWAGRGNNSRRMAVKERLRPHGPTTAKLVAWTNGTAFQTPSNQPTVDQGFNAAWKPCSCTFCCRSSLDAPIAGRFLRVPWTNSYACSGHLLSPYQSCQFLASNQRDTRLRNILREDNKAEKFSGVYQTRTAVPLGVSDMPSQSPISSLLCLTRSMQPLTKDPLL
jgi:hypothetical protein